MKKFISLILLFMGSHSYADYCEEQSLINYFKRRTFNITSCVYSGFSKTETIFRNNNIELFRVKYYDARMINKIVLSDISQLYFLTRNDSNCTIKPYPLPENIEKILNDNTDSYNCRGIPSSIDENEFYNFVKECVIKGSLKDYSNYSYFYIYTYVTVDKPDKLQQNHLVCDGEYTFSKCKWNVSFNTNCSYHSSIFNKIFGTRNNITTERNNNITTERNNITTERNNTYFSLNEKYNVTSEEMILIAIGSLAFLGLVTVLLTLSCVKKPEAIYHPVNRFNV